MKWTSACGFRFQRIQTGPIEYGLTIKPDKADLDSVYSGRNAIAHQPRKRGIYGGRTSCKPARCWMRSERDQRKWGVNALAEYVNPDHRRLYHQSDKPPGALPPRRPDGRDARAPARGRLADCARTIRPDSSETTRCPCCPAFLADFLGELTQMGGSQDPMTQFRQRRLERKQRRPPNSPRRLKARY